MSPSPAVQNNANRLQFATQPKDNTTIVPTLPNNHNESGQPRTKPTDMKSTISTTRFRRPITAALSTITLAVASCGPDLLYLPSLAAGQLDVILKSTTIESAIDSGTLTDDQVRKLNLILDVRDYAINEMNLEARDSFTHFVDVSETGTLFNVSASQADQLRALTWSFPVVGTVPYLGFFDADLAANHEADLIAQGYDTWTYEVAAYSTLNFLPNPVRSTMLNRDDVALVDVVIHELLHNTVYRPSDTDFNESLATFVGRMGAVQYIRDRHPDNTDAIDFAIARNQDSDRYVEFIFNFQNELIDYYNSNESSAAKIAGREEMFQSARDDFAANVQQRMNYPENYDWVQNLPTNNAWMLGNFRYNLDLDLFADVFTAAGSHWPTAIAVYQSAAVAPDPKAFLRDYIDDPESTPVAKRFPSALETRQPCCKPTIPSPSSVASPLVGDEKR